MERKQTIIKIPDELAHALDQLAGAKRRSAYAVDILWRDVRRARQRAALRSTTGAWRAGDHPELANGGAAQVDQIRSERDERFDTALERQKH
jgi:predicted transcriptional regulator